MRIRNKNIQIYLSAEYVPTCCCMSILTLYSGLVCNIINKINSSKSHYNNNNVPISPVLINVSKS